MGKYSTFKGQLTQFSLDQEYQDRVNEEKSRLRQTLVDQQLAPNAKNFGSLLVEARIKKARLETMVKEQNLIIEAMNQILVDFLESETISSLKLENGVSLSIKDDVYCSVSDRQVFNQWIRDNHLEDLFTVNYQTMNSMVKGRLMANENVPPGINTYFKQSISVRGAKQLDDE